MDEIIINGIDVSKYFINHYDNSGKLYAVEYNGNPLELQNAIKRLQKKNKELKEKIKLANCPYYNNGDCSCMGEVKRVYKYKQTLEEIKKEANRLLYEENPIYGYNNSNYFELLAKYVLAKTKEVLK